MSRAPKSMLTAYVLWFVLPFVGAHRFYLQRPLSGATQCIFLFAGLTVAWLGSTSPDQSLLLAGATCFLGTVVWILMDAALIPGMVRACNGEQEVGARTFINGPVNLDPSFSATKDRAGMSDEPTGKPRLPEDYEMPWRKDSQKPTVVRYRSQDET